MIGKLIRSGRWALVYFCVATVIAQAAAAVYFAARWGLDRDRMTQILAIAQGVDLLAIHEKARPPVEPSTEQVSYEQIRRTRAIEVRHLELREQALRDARDELAFQQKELTAQRQQYEQAREAFEKDLLAMQEKALTAGRENVRRKLEAVRSKQAKQILVQMAKDDELDEVVALLAEMSTSKAARIMGEYETPEEIEQLGEILRRIREGFPDFELAANARGRLPATEGSAN